MRSADKARGVFFELDLKEGAEAAGAGSGALFIAGGVDVTDGATITPDLFDGVTQVCVGLDACKLVFQSAWVTPSLPPACAHA